MTDETGKAIHKKGVVVRRVTPAQIAMVMRTELYCDVKNSFDTVDEEGKKTTHNLNTPMYWVFIRDKHTGVVTESYQATDTITGRSSVELWRKFSLVGRESMLFECWYVNRETGVERYL